MPSAAREGDRPFGGALSDCRADEDIVSEEELIGYLGKALMRVDIFKASDDRLAALGRGIGEIDDDIRHLFMQVHRVRDEGGIFFGKSIPRCPRELHHRAECRRLCHTDEEFFIGLEIGASVKAPLAAADHIGADERVTHETLKKNARDEGVKSVAVPAVASVAEASDHGSTSAVEGVFIFMEAISCAEIVPCAIECGGIHIVARSTVYDALRIIHSIRAAVEFEAVDAEIFDKFIKS